MKILLLGKNGQLGWELQRSLAPLGELVALDRHSTDHCGDFSDLAGLAATVRALRPDVIVIDTESPTRDVLEHLVIVSQSSPRPIVMFSTDSGGEAIRGAVRAGVSAYVVDGLDAARVNTIIEVACARFEQFQNLKAELAEANLKLSDRKLVERAKGLLMQSRGLSEDEAYHALRKLAMAKKQRLGDVAQQVIAAADLLGKA